MCRTREKERQSGGILVAALHCIALRLVIHLFIHGAKPVGWVGERFVRYSRERDSKQSTTEQYYITLCSLHWRGQGRWEINQMFLVEFKSKDN